MEMYQAQSDILQPPQKAFNINCSNNKKDNMYIPNNWFFSKKSLTGTELWAVALL